MKNKRERQRDREKLITVKKTTYLKNILQQQHDSKTKHSLVRRAFTLLPVIILLYFYNVTITKKAKIRIILSTLNSYRFYREFLTNFSRTNGCKGRSSKKMFEICSCRTSGNTFFGQENSRKKEKPRKLLHYI